MPLSLPPSPNTPQRSPNEKFFAFLLRNSGLDIPVLPNPFYELEFHWLMHESSPGHVQPFVVESSEISRIALEQTHGLNVTPLAFRAMSAMDTWLSVQCYDDPAAWPQDKASGKAWLEKLTLHELSLQCALNDFGITFISNGRLFQLVPSTVRDLTGLLPKQQHTDEVDPPDDFTIGDSRLSKKREELFRELMDREDWIHHDTIEFISCDVGEGHGVVDGVTFHLKPGISKPRLKRECGELGEACSLVTGKPFVVIPKEPLQRGPVFDLN